MDFITNLHIIVQENEKAIKELSTFNNESIVKEGIIQMNRINATKTVILPFTYGKGKNQEIIKIYEELTEQWGTINEMFEKALNR
jgi:uncharacterized protein YrzB (UPF0473 family)